jgi:hypothetical protein
MPTRIVVADQSEARFYDIERFAAPLRLVGQLTDPKARLHDRDFKSDRPGRVFDHASAAGKRRGAMAHHGTGGERSPRMHEAQVIKGDDADQVAGDIDDRRAPHTSRTQAFDRFGQAARRRDRQRIAGHDVAHCQAKHVCPTRELSAYDVAVRAIPTGSDAFPPRLHHNHRSSMPPSHLARRHHEMYLARCVPLLGKRCTDWRLTALRKPGDFAINTSQSSASSTRSAV